jgi:hypothetical protein
MPDTSECEYLSWESEDLLPTPNAMDSMGARSEEAIDHLMTGQRKGRTKLSTLKDAVVHGLEWPPKSEMFPSPNARDYKGWSPGHKRAENLRNSLDFCIEGAVKLKKVETFPTPQEDDASNVFPKENRRISLVGVVNDSTGNNPSAPLGQLNPNWVEWLMGFPIGWTDLNV